MPHKAKQAIFLTLIGLVGTAIGLVGFWFVPSDDAISQSAPSTTLFSRLNAKVTHQAYSMDKNLYESFFKNAVPSKAPSEKVYSAIMPHHLVAGNYVAGLFKALSPENPKTIVLIGPNHFSTGKANIISSDRDWQTPYGEVRSDTSILSNLKNEGVLEVDSMAMENEHSISTLVPFIKKTWPDAKIIPIIIRNVRNQEGEFFKLAQALEKTLPKDSLLIASVDFSHYMSLEVADFHDELSKNVLQTGDLARVRKMEIDSQNSVRVLLKYNELKGAKNFVLTHHTNSAQIMKQLDLAETTSHVMGYFVQTENVIATLTSIQFFGDMMLERNVAKAMGKDGLDYLFKKLAGQENRFFYGADLIVANLEGPFAPARVPTTKSIAFRFDPSLAPQLKKYNFSIFSLSNNHTLDMSKANYEFTKKVLDQNGLKYFGHQTKEGVEYMKILGAEDGMAEPVAFIGLNNTDHALDMVKVKKMFEEAKKQARYIVPFVHWGNEYQRISHQTQRDLAHRLVDMGASAVIGAHPHVIQEMETYKDVPIFYSLGNFIFDQYFSKDTQEGISLGLTFQNGSVKDIFVFLFYGLKSQVNLMSGKRKEEFFTWWNKNSRLDGRIFEEGKLNVK